MTTDPYFDKLVKQTKLWDIILIEIYECGRKPIS